jgi:hypothetical protein
VSVLANGSRRLRRRESRRLPPPGGDRHETGLPADLARARRADTPDGAGSRPEARGELGVYIGGELDRGRALFDVLGDPFVWTRFQDDPFLLSRMAGDERVLAALARNSRRSLPQSGGGAVR